MKSKTITQVLSLFNHLPAKRYQAFRWIVPLSFLPGILDLSCIWSIANLTRSLAGSSEKFPANLGVWTNRNRLDEIVFFSLLFMATAWLASFAKLVLRLRQQRLASKIWEDIITLSFKSLVNQPLSFHLSISSSDYSKQLIANLNLLAINVLTPVIQLISALASILILTLGIVLIARARAVVLVALLVIGYYVVSSAVTPRLRVASAERIESQSKAISLLSDTMQSIRDIRLTNSDSFFSNLFASAASSSSEAIWIAEWLPELPRGLIEPLGITLIFVIGALPAILSGDSGQLSSILPFLATVSLAALRLTPPLQDLFRGLTKVRGSTPLIKDLNQVLELPVCEKSMLMDQNSPSPSGIAPRRTVMLRDAWYRYTDSGNWVLKGVSINIPVGSRIAFVGKSGSGKTTAAGLLLGFLNPQIGQLELDGIRVEDYEVRAWQQNCSHVPQSIHLINASILANVAFGIPFDLVDHNRVWEALEAAQLHSFVAELPNTIYTVTGDNALCLSGGQRQRIALARAFYRNSNFLVLDEATSALDNRTELDVIESLDIIGRSCTTVVIAHRLSTVKRCDRIYEFDQGQVKCFGTYEEMRIKSPTFSVLSELEDQIM